MLYISFCAGRSLGLPEEKGCLLSLTDGNASLDIRDSLSLPISIIDAGKVRI